MFLKTNFLLYSYEIRAYSHRHKLDNANAKIITIESEVYLLSLHQNRLLALCSNGSIFLFDLHLFTTRTQNHPNSRLAMNGGDYSHQYNNQTSTTELNISAPIRVKAANLDIFADCVTVCLLTDLHVDMYHSAFQSESTHRSHLIQTSAVARSHSILINMCGRVLLLEMDVDTTGLPLSEEEDDEEDVETGDDDEDLDENVIEVERRISMQRQRSTSDATEHLAASANNMPRRVNGDYEPSTIKYRKAVKLASNVENLWILPHDDATLNQAFRPSLSSPSSHSPTQPLPQNHLQLRPHLVTSLYLSCGAQGMAVWLSLEHSIRRHNQRSANESFSVPSEYKSPRTNRSSYLPSESSGQQQHNAYISKRIMLPIREIATTIYPLAIRFREAIVLGAESDFTHPNSFSLSSTGNGSTTPSNGQQPLYIPFCLVKRTSQVYLHYVLRELLRRNLGYRAWEIANTCTALPHFVHSLELLLHGVLEEEASSSQPIPDALLPRVVEFIRAFPVFLQTVINCARKTEYARWPHLFSVVGSPRDLFQQCLLEGQLETASGYIIVLHNLEKPEVATRCASRLLQAARLAGSWVTVKELKRFLRSTNGDNESVASAAGVGEVVVAPSTVVSPTSPRVSESNDQMAVTSEANVITKNTTELRQDSEVASNVNTTSQLVGNTVMTNGSITPTLHHQLNRSVSIEQETTTTNSAKQIMTTSSSSTITSSLTVTGSISQNSLSSPRTTTATMAPGAAIKQKLQTGGKFIVPETATVQAVAAAVVAADEANRNSTKNYNGDHLSLDQNDLSELEAVEGEELVVVSKGVPDLHSTPMKAPLMMNNHQKQNGRAYPGSIRRLNQEVHPNAPFHFLAASTQPLTARVNHVTSNPKTLVTSSTSSISSTFSSASSSTLSSASVSPSVNINAVVNNISIDKKTSTLSEKIMMNGSAGSNATTLNAVAINADGEEGGQCVIS